MQKLSIFAMVKNLNEFVNLTKITANIKLDIN